MFDVHRPRGDFELAAGSVPGRAHALAGKPGQDAAVLRAGAGSLVAIVSDGCSSAEHAEVGAWIGAHIVATEVARATGRDLDEPAFWEEAQRRALSALRVAATAMGGDFEEVVRSFFLFTVVGAVIAGERAAVFSMGDGLYAINGEVARLGPFPGNAPPYMGHALLGAEVRFVVHRVMPAAEVESIVVATDGAVEWSSVADRLIPGSREVVGELSQVWRDDRYFEHPDALRRKLARMNRPVVRPVWEDRRLVKETGLLEDDTTIAVVRARRPVAQRAA